jgi:hypothetical protein
MDEAASMISNAALGIRLTRLVGDDDPDGQQALWIYLPIAGAALVVPELEMPRHCETPRCRTRGRAATTFHALLNRQREPDSAWVACDECTGLMLNLMGERDAAGAFH